jgi:predicted DCC family thiol-disulfide oxidoreductase YuxK
MIIPKALRDFVYGVVARYRQRIFSKKVCWLPTPEQQKKILE